MFNLEIFFNTKDMDAAASQELLEKFDNIFTKWHLSCTESKQDCRVYQTRGTEQDFAHMWGALFQIKRDRWLTDHVAACTYVNARGILEDVSRDFLEVDCS